jgi:hypothetical protein
MVTFMNEIGMETFLKQFADSPARLAWVEANLEDADQELLRDFLDEVDESHYSLRQWIDALIVMCHWLDARGLAASLEDRIGFAGCANAAAGAGANLTSLSALVSEMLDNYGFERSVTIKKL